MRYKKNKEVTVCKYKITFLVMADENRMITNINMFCDINTIFENVVKLK